MLSKFKALSRKTKGFTVVGVLVLLGLAGSADNTQPAAKQLQVQKTSTSNQAVLSDSTQKQAPVVTTTRTTETQPIPFTTTQVNDPNLPKGQTKLTVTGANGVSTLTYEVTTTNGVQTAKGLVSQVTTSQPVTQVIAIGTYVAPAPTPKPVAIASNCDPNYTGCVPNVYPSDVDCAGGSGNGPYYASGPIRVIGTDHYGLDRDGDGYACE